MRKTASQNTQVKYFFFVIFGLFTKRIKKTKKNIAHQFTFYIRGPSSKYVNIFVLY